MGDFKKFVELKEALEYCDKKNTKLSSLFRVGSKAYYSVLNEARKQFLNNNIKLNPIDEYLVKETDIGKFDVYKGKNVPLDSPMIQEDETKELNKPKRGGPKKYYVYVRNPDTGNVVRVNFGDPDMRVKLDNEKARKSFVARHQCDKKKDKTTPGYWSCRLPMYADDLGLSGGGNFFW